MPDIQPDLVRAKEQAEAALLDIPGVTGVDIGLKEVGGRPTDTVAIRVLVAEKKPKSKVPKAQVIPPEIEGHPTDVIQRRFELHAFGAAVPVDEVKARPDVGRYAPLRGGVGVGPCRAVAGFVHIGTLGAVVTDNDTGKHLLLSNFHILCVDNGSSDGDAIAQPSLVDGGNCPGDVVAALGRHALTDTVDAAVAEISTDRGFLAEVIDIGPLCGTAEARIGEPVRKRGRTTRLTHGIVDSVSLTLRLDYGPGVGEKTLTSQIGVRSDPAKNRRFSAKGDSGSVLVNETGEVVGLHFSGDETGYGVANPISDVVEALNVSIATGASTGQPSKEDRVSKPLKNEADKVNIKAEGKDHKLEIKDFKEKEKLEKPEKREGIDKKPEKFEGIDKPHRGEGKLAAKDLEKVRKDKDVDADPQAAFKRLETKGINDPPEKSNLRDKALVKPELKDVKEKERKDEIKEKELKDEIKEKERKDEIKEKELKDEIKEKEEKEFKEKEEKDEIKEKERKDEIKEKPEKDEIKEKEDKEFKEDPKEFKDKDKDFAEKDLVEGPFDPGPVVQGGARKLVVENVKLRKSEIKEFKIEIKDRKEKFEIKDFKEREIPDWGDKIKDKDKDAEVPGGFDPAVSPQGGVTAKAADKIAEATQKRLVEKHWFEKNRVKDWKDNKNEKMEVEYERPPFEIPDPGPLAQRLASLEATVVRLGHFIQSEQRPDLSEGALSGEPDLAAQSADLKQAAEAAKQAKDDKDVEKLRETGPSGTGQQAAGQQAAGQQDGGQQDEGQQDEGQKGKGQQGKGRGDS